MTDSPIDALFDTLDAWRHLPAYQLERRADIFFALYLREVLEAELDVHVHPELIPELPLRLGTLRPESGGSNQSKKVDYAAFEPDEGRVWLVELKTDAASRNSKQDDYLVAASERRFQDIVAGIRTITLATGATHRSKYLHLVHALSRWGFMELPPSLREDSPHSTGHAFSEVRVVGDASVDVVYVQPTADRGGDQAIGFERFASIVERNGDRLSQRFARSLRLWSRTVAGGGGVAPWGEP